jgi:hypothetical protein
MPLGTAYMPPNEIEGKSVETPVAISDPATTPVVRCSGYIPAVPDRRAYSFARDCCRILPVPD